MGKYFHFYFLHKAWKGAPHSCAETFAPEQKEETNPKEEKGAEVNKNGPSDIR